MEGSLIEKWEWEARNKSHLDIVLSSRLTTEKRRETEWQGKIQSEDLLSFCWKMQDWVYLYAKEEELKEGINLKIPETTPFHMLCILSKPKGQALTHSGKSVIPLDECGQQSLVVKSTEFDGQTTWTWTPELPFTSCVTLPSVCLSFLFCGQG